MQNGEPQIYTALATMRNGYMQAQWSRVQMFLAFNVIASPLALSSGTSKDLKFVICWAGIIIHLFLIQGVLRANRWMRLIDAKLQLLELLDADTNNGSRVRFFSDSDFDRTRYALTASRRLFGYMGALALSGWILLTYIYWHVIML